MLYGLILFAEEEAKKGEGLSMLNALAPIVLIVIVFYFLIILPGRKEKQQRQILLNALKKNDKVLTNGGIIGVVLNIREGTDEVTIKSDETKLLILRSSIARIITESPKDSATPNKPTT